jgi:sec-independent protein translocase protein TatB
VFDINAPEFVVLVVIAIILFGPEKLPDFARKAARVIRYVRTIAGSAQEQLSRELGPGFEDVDFRDLNPKAFIQKHLLEDVDPIVADVKQEFADLGSSARGAASDIATAIDSVKDTSPGGPLNVGDGLSPGGLNNGPVVPVRELTPFDPDST